MPSFCSAFLYNGHYATVLVMDESLKVLAKDKYFARLIKQYEKPTMGWGRDLPTNKNIFQALVRSIVYQQLSGKAAATIFARFIALFNKPNTPPNKLRPARRQARFPKPEEVLRMPLEKLRSVGLSRPKVAYIQDLAKKFADGTIQHKTLHKMSTEEITAHLTQVKGVGVWTVHMLQIFTLGRLDVLPTGDLAIRKGFQIVYKLKKLPTHAEMEALAKNWRAHASVASWYLWRVADGAKITGKIKKAGRS